MVVLLERDIQRAPTVPPGHRSYGSHHIATTGPWPGTYNRALNGFLSFGAVSIGCQRSGSQSDNGLADMQSGSMDASSSASSRVYRPASWTCCA